MTSRAACCARGPRRTRQRTLCSVLTTRTAGRELMRRVSAVVTSAANPASPLADTWVSVALTLAGSRPSACRRIPRQLRVGVPTGDGRACRKAGGHRRQRPGELGSAAQDAGRPCRTRRGLAGWSAARAARARSGGVPGAAPGITAIWRQNCHALPTEKEPFGFRDGISHPAIAGSGIPGTNPQEQPLKAGEFVLGYPDEMGGIQRTQPEVLGRNGTYVVFRKLHQRVAAFRRYLNELDQPWRRNSWRQADGALAQRRTLALCPVHDDPELGRTRDVTTISSIKR